MAKIEANGLSQGDLVTFLNNVITMCNEIKADYNALLTKLDSDVGVTDTNYVSLRTVATTDLTLSV